MRLFIYIPFLFFLFVTINGHSQPCADKYTLLTKNYNDTILNEKVDSLLATCKRQHGVEEAITIAHKYVIANYRAGNYTNAIAYSHKEINWYEENKLYTVKYTDALYNLGRFYEIRRNNVLASKYYKKVALTNIDSLNTAKAYCQLGELYYKEDDPFNAVIYYKKGLSFYRNLKQNRSLFRKNLDLARIYEHINDKESLAAKLARLKEADSLAVFTRVSSRDIMIKNNHYASYYNNPSTFDFLKSSYYYKKNIASALQTNDTLLLSTTYANLANLYLKNKNDSASFYIDRALSYDSPKVDRARILNIKTNYLLANGQDSLALKAIHESFLLSTGGQFSEEELPNIQQLSNAQDKKLLLWGLSKRAKIFINQYSDLNNTKALKKALLSIRLADVLIDKMYLGAHQTASKLLWRKTASSIYGMGVFIAHSLDLPNEAFYFAEKKKAVLLTQEVVQNSQKALLPKELSSKQAILSDLRLDLEYRRSVEPYKQQLTALEDSIFKVSQQQSRLKDSIAIAFPKYAKMVHKTTITSLSKAQSKLDSQTVVLHFIWDSKGAQMSQPGLMLITNKKTYYSAYKEPEAILKNIQDYNKAITTPFSTKTTEQDFYNVSYALYNQLFSSPQIKAQIKGKNLVIIPDGPLYNLAFEAFITDREPTQYLIEKHQISYAQSLSFKQTNNQLNRTTNSTYIGFAPTNYSHSQLVDLPFAKSEINKALEVFNGMSFTLENANRNTFFNQLPRAKIVHLATHAQSKGNSWIALNDSLVLLHELYNKNIPAQLVVISGCSTNLGKSLEGEGVASLARGFFYAGANSVVSTLWNANDKTTAQISANFFKELKKGKSKAVALRNAKLNYLQNSSLSEAAPYYWASLVLIGDQGTLPLTTNSTHQLLFLLLLLFFAGLIVFKK